jgi:hypothetical protein
MDTPEIGWQVVDPEGNVVASGPVVVAEAAGDLAELLGIDPKEQ